MRTHTKPLATTIASVLAAASLVVMAAPAHALGPNAIVPGFNSTVFGPNDDGTYPCIGPDSGDPSVAIPPCPSPPAQIALPFTINFFGTNYNKLFLNNNGNVTFDARLATFTPFNLSTTGRVIIAPFFADVDTRVGNTVTFGTGTVDGHVTWGANWPGVGCYNQNGGVLDYFQMLLIDRSDVAPNDFDIEFNYDKVQWDSGQQSGGGARCLNGDSARVGYSNGTATNSFELPGSGVANAFVDSNSATGLVHNSLNSSHLGRYIFSIRSGQPTDTTAPSCKLTATFNGPPKGIQVTTQDGGASDSGLKSIVVTKNVNANVVIPAFTQGTKDPVVVTATRVDNNVSAQVALRVTDVKGNITNCDPVLTTLVKENKPQVFTDVPDAEHLVTVMNGSPGLRRIAVTVNGTAYRRTLQAGQQATIDVVNSIRTGANTFRLTGWGRGSADIIIWDGNGTI